MTPATHRRFLREPLGAGRIPDAFIPLLEEELDSRAKTYSSIPGSAGGFDIHAVRGELARIAHLESAKYEWNRLVPSLRNHLSFTKELHNRELADALSGKALYHPPQLLALCDALQELLVALADAGTEWFGWGRQKPGGDPERDIQAATERVRARLIDAERQIRSDLAPDDPARAAALHETLAFLSPARELLERGEDDLRALIQRIELACEHLMGMKSRHDPIPIVAQDVPKRKPGGYTAGELREEAESAGARCGETKFREIRLVAGIESPKAGQHHRYGNSDIRKLAAAAQEGGKVNGKFRSFTGGEVIAGAWLGLIERESSKN